METLPLLLQKKTAENFAARLAQANLASKNDISNFIKKPNFDDKLKNLNKKITLNKAKHVLLQNELKNYIHLTQVLLLLKANFVMMERSFT